MTDARSQRDPLFYETLNTRPNAAACFLVLVYTTVFNASALVSFL